MEEQKQKEIVFPSRKAFRRAVLPPVGLKIGDCKVIYVHETKLRFTAMGTILPEPSQHISIGGAVFQVEYVDNDKHRFSAGFIGFEKPVEEKQPKNDTSEITKLID